MSRTAKITLTAVAILFVGLLVYSSLRLGAVAVEVCVEFKGRANCGTAAAPTEEEAIRTATDNACAIISSGVTESIACSSTPPQSVRRLDD
ncbi:MAG TPA: hypothetical protein VJ085_00830 [Candidatus Acidoferrales bacterium]|nr:hypothetical protein [Candidatus Acidoferrales bacterium]